MKHPLRSTQPLLVRGARGSAGDRRASPGPKVCVANLGGAARSSARLEQAEVLVALRHIVNARSSIQKVAEQTELNANTLYRTLSPTGNPELRSLSKVLNAVGLKIAIEPL